MAILRRGLHTLTLRATSLAGALSHSAAHCSLAIPDLCCLGDGVRLTRSVLGRSTTLRRRSRNRADMRVGCTAARSLAALHHPMKHLLLVFALLRRMPPPPARRGRAGRRLVPCKSPPARVCPSIAGKFGRLFEARLHGNRRRCPRTAEGTFNDLRRRLDAHTSRCVMTGPRDAPRVLFIAEVGLAPRRASMSPSTVAFQGLAAGTDGTPVGRGSGHCALVSNGGPLCRNLVSQPPASCY